VGSRGPQGVSRKLDSEILSQLADRPYRVERVQGGRETQQAENHFAWKARCNDAPCVPNSKTKGQFTERVKRHPKRLDTCVHLCSVMVDPGNCLLCIPKDTWEILCIPSHIPSAYCTSLGKVPPSISMISDHLRLRPISLSSISRITSERDLQSWFPDVLSMLTQEYQTGPQSQKDVCVCVQIEAETPSNRSRLREHVAKCGQQVQHGLRALRIEAIWKPERPNRAEIELIEPRPTLLIYIRTIQGHQIEDVFHGQTCPTKLG